MSRNRYYEIKKYLRFADNQNLTEGDKMSKIAPLYEMLNRNLFQFGIFNKLLSVYESMVPYFGWHSAKIFIRGKLIRFGFKIWLLMRQRWFSRQHQDLSRKGEKVVDKTSDAVPTQSSTTP